MDNTKEVKLDIKLETDEFNTTKIKTGLKVYDEYIISFIRYAYLPLSEDILDHLSNQLQCDYNVVKVTLTDHESLILLMPIGSEIKENGNLLKIATLLGDVVINRDFVKCLVIT